MKSDSAKSQDQSPELDLSKKGSATHTSVQLKTQLPQISPLKPEPVDKLTTTFPRNAPRYRLTKHITLMKDGEIISLMPGKIVKLVSVSFKERDKCRILALHEETILRIEVWRDYLGEKPLWAPEPTRMEFWKEVKVVVKIFGAWAGKKRAGLREKEGSEGGGGEA